MSKSKRLSRSVPALFGAMAGAPAHAAWTLNMPKGVTDTTAEVFDLHMMIFWICVVIGIGVFGVMLYSVIAHRKSRGHEAAHFHESTAVEIAWTVIPFLILVAVAVPTAGMLLKVEDSSHPDMTIRVTGHQWLWEYKYLDNGVHFYSRLDARSNRARQPGSDLKPSDVKHYLRNVDHPMVVPVHEKVRLLLTSGDVIHAWWVPQLSGKKDAIPGYINDIWFNANKIGTYRGQCAELCGRGHAYMPIVVKVVSKNDYKNWVARQGGNAGAAARSEANQPASAQPSPSQGQQSNRHRTGGANSGAAAGQSQGQSGAGGQGGGQGNVPQGSMNRHRANNGNGAAPPPGSGGNNAAKSRDNTPNAEAQSGAGAGHNGGGGQQREGAAHNASGKQMSKQALMAQGKKVYANICSACHQANGKGLPAAGYPSLAGSKVATGPIADHIAQVLNGKKAMPPYRGTLDNKQIAGVVTYERNAFGNHTGDVVQPAQVAKQR